MAVVINGVGYRYRRRADLALCDVTVEFRPGRTILLGPNGAGKSTLLSILAGLAKPTYGTVEVTAGDGRPSVGWMAQQIRPLRGFTVTEQIAYSGWLAGLTKRQAWGSARRVLGRVDLDDRADTKAMALSGGQLRRLGLAQALVHDPAILLLDEPTAGLDIAQRENFANLLRTISATVDHTLVATHDVADLTTSFDDVAVIAHGQIRFHGTVGEFVGSRSTTDTKGAIIAAYERALAHPLEKSA
ncbi:ATP-binding cassette domain-containing protein [Demequina lutea]|nr:ATP-binding cassette domain-containing protein [Demequina lutea]